MARRRSARRTSPHWFSSLLVGVAAGLGLAAVGLWMSHSRAAPRGAPTADSAIGPASTRAATDGPGAAGDAVRPRAAAPGVGAAARPRAGAGDGEGARGRHLRRCRV